MVKGKEKSKQRYDRRLYTEETKLQLRKIGAVEEHQSDFLMDVSRRMEGNQEDHERKQWSGKKSKELA